MTLTRKLALLLAGALTAFLLVTAGALISYGGSQSQAASAQTQNQAHQFAATGASTDTAAGTPNNTVADQPQTSGQGQPSGDQAQAQAQAPSDNTTATAPGYPISVEQAAALALQATPGTFLQTTPMLVNLNGTIAYEVALDQGPVYIDANSGAVLYNGTSIATGNPNGAAGFSGDDHEANEHRDGFGERGEHEEFENGNH